MPSAEEKLETLRDNAGEDIDFQTFGQILEMDDSDEDREFSSSIVFGFFDQAEETFESMDKALKEKDLDQLSSLGHFLKGSSATLGMVQVRDLCEKIQRYGKMEDEEGGKLDDKALCLKKTDESVKALKEKYERAKVLLQAFFDSEEEGEDEEPAAATAAPAAPAAPAAAPAAAATPAAPSANKN